MDKLFATTILELLGVEEAQGDTSTITRLATNPQLEAARRWVLAQVMQSEIPTAPRLIDPDVVKDFETLPEPMRVMCERAAVLARRRWRAIEIAKEDAAPRPPIAALGLTSSEVAALEKQLNEGGTVDAAVSLELHRKLGKDAPALTQAIFMWRASRARAFKLRDADAKDKLPEEVSRENAKGLLASATAKVAAAAAREQQRKALDANMAEAARIRAELQQPV